MEDLCVSLVSKLLLLEKIILIYKGFISDLKLIPYYLIECGAVFLGLPPGKGVVGRGQCVSRGG